MSTQTTPVEIHLRNLIVAINLAQQRGAYQLHESAQIHAILTTLVQAYPSLATPLPLPLPLPLPKPQQQSQSE